MKKIIVVMLFQTLLSLCSFGQNKEYKRENLLTSFENRNSYEALETYINGSGFLFDYKLIYYDKELRDHLLKLLDVNEYVKYELEKYRIYCKRLIDNDEEEGKKDIYQVSQFVINECNLNFDSIYSDKNLYLHYKDLTLNWLVERENIRLQKHESDVLASNLALTLHSYIRYPDAYSIMKDWWVKKNTPCIDETTGVNSFCIYLLRMNDPEIKIEIDKLVNSLFNSKDKKLVLPTVLMLQERLLTSYSIEKLIQLAKLKMEVSIMTHDESIDVSLYILKYLNSVCFRYGLLDHNILEELEQKEIFGRKRDKVFYDNREKIISAAKLLVEKLKTEEEYWMVNMSFHRGELDNP